MQRKLLIAAMCVWGGALAVVMAILVTCAISEPFAVWVMENENVGSRVVVVFSVVIIVYFAQWLACVRHARTCAALSPSAKRRWYWQLVMAGALAVPWFTLRHMLPELAEDAQARRGLSTTSGPDSEG